MVRDVFLREVTMLILEKSGQKSVFKTFLTNGPFLMMTSAQKKPYSRQIGISPVQDPKSMPVYFFSCEKLKLLKIISDKFHLSILLEYSNSFLFFGI